MSLFAAAAAAGGAAGIRANSPADIRAIRAVTDVPIIGIDKTPLPDGFLLITASFESARALVDPKEARMSKKTEATRHVGMPRDSQAARSQPLSMDIEELKHISSGTQICTLAL